MEEIKKITQIIETEVFVQGALCTCFSGHCYFSSFIGGLSGNRGACRQPCRKLYKYEGNSIHDEMRYALSLADLSVPNRLNELITAGVKSFKIEGRMRSFEYVCASCDFYNSLLYGDEISRLKSENLKRTYNRGGYTEGLAFGQKKNFISDKIQNHAGSVIATVSAIKGNELILSGLKHKIAVGDCFKILTSGYETGHAMAVEKNGKVCVLFREKAFVGSELSITKDISLTEKYKNKQKLHPVTVNVTANVGEPLKLTLNGRDYLSDFIVAEALTSSVTKSEIKENLRKVDKYPFEVTPSCILDGKVFIPKKVMNELRARAYLDYFTSFANKNVKNDKIACFNFDFDNFYSANNAPLNEVTIISTDFNFQNFSGLKNLVFCPYDYNDNKQFEKFFTQAQKFNCEKFLYLPPFLNQKDESIFASRLEGFDGIYSECASGLFLAKRYKKKFFGGVELNVTNNLTYNALKSDGAYEIALSKELSRQEIANMHSGYVLTFGNIKIMSLIYCPLKKNCTSCKQNNILTLKDSALREFKVRRYKLSECRFEVYNEKMLRSKFEFSKQIFDFTTLNDKEINELLNLYLNNGKNEKRAFTSGNLVKGVE